MILQAEAAECGVACVAMVAGYHGLEVDLPALRSVGGVSLRGGSLKQLMQLTANLGLATRPLRLEPGELGQLQCPAILHWDLTHFVVLKAVGPRHIVIHNPAVGVRRYRLEEASPHISGVALELWPAETFEPRRLTHRMHLTDFWSKARGLASSVVQVLVLSLVLQLVSLASPFYVQLVVDEAIVKRDLDLVSVLALGFFLLTLIRVGTTALRAWVLVYFGSLMGFQMSAHLFQHLIRLPLPWFQRRHMGDVVSRFGSLEPIRRLFTEGLVSTVVDGLMAITTLVMMLLYSPLLTLVVIVAVVLYAVGKLIWYPIERRRTEENIAASAREETTFMETVRAIQAIKVFGKEGERQTLWQNRQAEVINSGVAVARLGIGYGAWNAMLFGIENVLVIYLGARFVLQDAFSVGMLYAFVAYKSQFSERFSALIDRVMELRMVGLHLERLSD
ncbi:MAG: ABC transporter transmembrane domain-containing protein, partial [Pseudomonadales bacterium]